MFKQSINKIISLIFILISMAAYSGIAFSEEEKGTVEVKLQESKPVPETLKSARATMETFLSSMNDIKRGEVEKIDLAVTTMDLSSVNPLVLNERSKNLAWMLLEIMDRTRLVELKRLPDKEEGKPYIFASYDAGVIRIARYPDGRWLFDNETIVNLEKIWEEVEGRSKVAGLEDTSDAHLPFHMRIRNQVPGELQKVRFLLETWQWIGILIIIGIGTLLDKLISILLVLIVRNFRRRRENSSLSGVDDDILRPLGLMVMAATWWAGINLMGLPEQAMLILLVAVKFLAGVSGVWGAYRLVDIVGVYLLKRAKATDTKMDDALVPLIPKTLKIFVTVIGIVFIADNLNINVSGLIAGLGLGGLAFALAAKDMVQNLFGSVTILLDKTFAVGDWIIVDGSEGSVERIGFRSTRIRTFYNSVLTVPNSAFITATVDNMGERRYRRFKSKLGLTYQTPPEKVEAFCEGVRELVRQHPYMRKDYYHVYFNGYADSALEILVYVFWETPEWGTELRERHRFLLDILRLAREIGVDFAYPTQTLFMKRDDTTEPEHEGLSLAGELDSSRDIARKIVDDSTGLNVKPPPVRY